ncbi:unnamed protein product [Allacma fusca]|uniref:Uncharacterized protein n=1 Tax=Allacma fusca TaxID=39272 RepID=A0A8J2J6P7_9HEXA|nr:unnamed protein product [Allacma fusca]
MEGLKKERRTYKCQVTYLKKIVDGYPADPPTDGTLEIHFQRIEKLEREMGENQMAVGSLLENDDDFERENQYYERENERIYGIKGTIRDLLNQRRPTPQVVPGQQPVQIQVPVNNSSTIILWRFHENENIQEFKSVTVTFGTSSAPGLATQTLCQLANDERDNDPIAAPVLLKDAYVDDVVTGQNSASEAIELYKQLDNLTKSACFELSKWVSNDPAVMNAIPTAARGTSFPLAFTDDDAVKTLGLYWHPAIDCFQFTVSPFDFQQKLTKREILSDTAKLFDPL